MRVTLGGCEWVGGCLPVPPGSARARAVLVDDFEENVAAARSLGIEAYQVEGVDGLRERRTRLIERGNDGL